MTSNKQGTGIELKDVIHFYLGCEVIHASFGQKPFELKGIQEPWVSANQPKVFLSFIRDYDSDPIIEDSCYELFDKIKIVLRPLPSLTKQEMEECGNLLYDFSNEPELNCWEWTNFQIGLAAEQFLWLIKRQFDVFNLIESGQALNKYLIKLPVPQYPSKENGFNRGFNRDFPKEF